MRTILFLLISATTVLTSCNKDNSPTPNLVIKLKFDADQERLDNLGQPAAIAAGNATQTPVFRRMSLNYIELAPSALTLLGQGAVVFEGPETNKGGAIAIDFQQAEFAGNEEVFVEIPLSEVNPGSYEWLRTSLAYQEGEIAMLSSGLTFEGTLSAFLGYNTYITEFDINAQPLAVNGNRLQGFWAFEAFGTLFSGQAPPGATTVPNPLFDTSPVPAGSCVVTGEFADPLTITGEETEDIEVTLSFSVNESFEWIDLNPDGMYEPGAGETLVDMGVRGLIPIVD